MYVWVRDHRLHHKYSDTDADPHNAKRGFFFSHCGWLMMRKHPDVIVKGKTIDMSDLSNDPLIVFQRRYLLSRFFFKNGIGEVLIGIMGATNVTYESIQHGQLITITSIRCYGGFSRESPVYTLDKTTEIHLHF